jgi:hypothetical protein
LNLSKQNRWLWKNNALSDKIVLKSSSWTALKKLYGNPILDKNASNLNIWYSNNLNKSINFVKLNHITNSYTTDRYSLVNLLNSSNFFLNLNTYETSLFWTAKRYKFLQNLNTNINQSNYKIISDLKLPASGTTYFSEYGLMSNSIIFDYKSSQTGLLVTTTKSILPHNTESVVSYRPNIIYDLNKDILSSMDSDFLTYISKDIMLKNYNLNFFTNSI